MVANAGKRLDKSGHPREPYAAVAEKLHAKVAYQR